MSIRLFILIVLSLFFLPYKVYAADPGTCTAVTTTAGGRYITTVSENKCSAGYKPLGQYLNGITSCQCLPETSTSCSTSGSSCRNDSECQIGSACSGFTCIGYTAGVTAFGSCLPQGTQCSKSNATCNTNADCASGGTACANYTCWTLDGGSKKCQVGQQPASGDSTSANPLPNPCDKTSDYSTCDTALGPLAATPENFIRSAYGSILSMSGGIAVLLIIMSGYSLMTSQGNPEKVKGAQERLTAAIVGLLFIIFAFVILETIGVDILAIPGLTR